MKKLLLVLFVFCVLMTHAQITQVSGNQSGVWSGEIHLVGDVVVPDAETLTINAGTNVISDGYFGIDVRGNLFANGAENSEITFTIADTTGYSNYDDHEAGAWKGFIFHKSGDVVLNYCDFSYGKSPIDNDGAMFWVYYVDDMEISHCKFHHNTTRRKGAAIYAENSSFIIHDCEICDNLAVGYETSFTWGVGFQFLKCDIDMHDMVFHDNYSETAYGGGMNIDSCNMVLNNAIFYDNWAVNAGGLGIQRCKDYTVKVSNMLAYNNHVVHYGGGLAMATSDPELNNLTIVNNYCGGGGGAGMQNAFDSNPTLNNCIFYGNHAIYTLNDKDDRDSVEYYYGSQIWLWGSDCFPIFNNGLVQYGLDSICNGEYLPEGHYNNMIDANPLFINDLEHDYRLSEGSPCIDTGTPDVTGLFIPNTDLSGGLRIVNGRIDMGCYEYGSLNLNEVAMSEKTALVYPNPLNDNSLCIVNLKKRCDATMKLISLDGKEIYHEDCGSLEAGDNYIPLARMMKDLEKKNELYLLIIDTQENRYINKIIY